MQAVVVPTVRRTSAGSVVVAGRVLWRTSPAVPPRICAGCADQPDTRWPCWRMTRNRIDESGRVRLDGDTLEYTLGQETVWTVPLCRLRVIGEYTTDAGPWFDDYFIVFVAADPFEILVAPVEAEGAVLAELSGRLGVEMSHGLANRTDLASRVLWPEELRDHPLFDFHPSERRPGVRSRVKDALIRRTDLAPTAEVRRYGGA